MIIWLIGISGSGKSVLANKIVSTVRNKKNNVVLIDGDNFRALFNNDLGYTINDRKKNAKRISNFCKFLDDNNIDVVCAILSIFSETRKWNRKNIKNYYEVFIDTPVDDVKKRDVKGIYKDFNEKKIRNVVGQDIKFNKPENPDLIIKNNGSLKEFLDYSKIIAEKITKIDKI